MLAVMNNAALNIYIQGFVWTYNLNSLGDILSGEIAGSYDNSIFNFLRNHQKIAKAVHNFVLRVSISLHPCFIIIYKIH